MTRAVPILVFFSSNQYLTKQPLYRWYFSKVKYAHVALFLSTNGEFYRYKIARSCNISPLRKLCKIKLDKLVSKRRALGEMDVYYGPTIYIKSLQDVPRLSDTNCSVSVGRCLRHLMLDYKHVGHIPSLISILTPASLRTFIRKKWKEFN